MARICCFRRSEIPESWLPQKGGLAASLSSFSMLNRLQMHWKERKTIEEDSDFKQCIPYCLIEKNGRIACYPRTGSESRLHELYSCGIGGHVEAVDAQSNLVKTLSHALQREIKEECDLNTPSEKLQFLGLINEEITEVGRVHLGFVYLLSLDAKQALQTTEEIKFIEWIDPQNHSFELECWSQLAIELYLGSRHYCEWFTI